MSQKFEVGDEVEIKPLRSVVRAYGKNDYVLLDDGIWYHHKLLKSIKKRKREVKKQKW